MRPLLLSLIITSMPATAQQVDWLVDRSVDYSLNPGLPQHALAVSTSGEAMAAYLSTASFLYGSEIFGTCMVQRIDPLDGAPLWNCMLLDTATVQSAAMDAEGNCYVAGRFMGDLALCDGSVLAHSAPATLWDPDLYLLKLAPDGALLWARNLSLSDPDASMITAMAVDPNGALWYATSDFLMGHVVRVDGSGSAVEDRAIHGAKTIGGLSFAASGALYVSGATDAIGVVFGGLAPPPPANASYLMFLARFDAQGQGDWAAYAHDITFQFPDAAACPDGGVVVACSAFDTTRWGELPINGSDWGMATFVVKADSTGHFMWSAESDLPGGAITGDFSPASSDAVSVDASGNVYLCGAARGTVPWGNGVSSTAGTITDRALAVVAFSAAGVPQWSVSSAASGFVSPMAIGTAADGHVLVGAHVNAALTLVPFTVNDAGQQVFAIARLSPLGTGMAESTRSDGWTVLPNPATRLLMLRHTGNEAFEICSVAGQPVRHGRLSNGANMIDLEGLSPGVYVLRMASGQAARFVKE